MRASNYSRARNLAAVFQRRRWFPERSKPKPEPPFVPPTPLPKVRSPQCRAVHFCDLYLAETYWYYQKRLRWEVFVSQPPVVESWGNVCDDKLPEPWTCNWDVWGLADCWSKETVPQLFARFGLAVQKPLTFRSTYNEQTATAFLGVEKPLENPMFYLYDDPTKDVFRFEGDVDGKAPVGAAEFLDTANWNKMTHLGSLTNPDAILRHRHIPEPPLIARNDHETPWGWEPREIRSPDEVRAYKENPAIRDWISISNKDLPSPWTCLWTYYSWNKTWRADLWQSYGLGTANPIMWHRGHQCRKTLLLESGGIFYLYDKGDEGWHEWFKKEDTFNSPLPLELLYRFDGEFSSVADFIERADWTRMSILAPRERGNELAPEENKQRHNVKLPLACDGGKLQILPPTS
ncbi:hypothetical protein FB451DRAFT_1301194 [Mycena latifolia]|nr:hypothetical protein FB451DRAFT_1301194 [Mycena latifolia]